MLSIFLKHLLPKRSHSKILVSALPWLTRGENCVQRAGIFPVNEQLNRFHTFSRLNCKEGNGRIYEEHEHYADFSADRSVASIKELVDQGQISEANALYEATKHELYDQLDYRGTLALIDILMRAECSAAAKNLVLNSRASELTVTSTRQTELILCSIFKRLIRQSNPEELELFAEHLVFKRKYVGRTVLEIIVGDLLYRKQEFDTILDTFERIANQFRETPLFHSLVCALITNDDTDRLERILAISTKVHGRVNSLYSLAFALNECNRTEQARKIFASIGNEQESERLEQCIERLQHRKQEKLLENMLAATDRCVHRQYREQIYLALLELAAYRGADITRICSAMDQEKIELSGQRLEKIVQICKRNGVNVPKPWLSATNKISPEAGNVDVSEEQLRVCLDANDIGKANELLLELMQAGKSLHRKSIRYSFMKNAERGNVDLFQHLAPKLDTSTKMQSDFFRYECAAYSNAKKSAEYLQMIRGILEQDQIDLKAVAINMPENLIDLIGESAETYEQFLALAKRFADKGVIKPVCICWTYNFLNDEKSEENDVIWDTYLKFHGTILCKVVINLLDYRKEMEKLRKFLNYDRLDKDRIAKSELGRAYSKLFDKLYYNADYDGIIDELEQMVQTVPMKYLASKTVERIKFGPPELKERFWDVINDAKCK